MMIIAISTPAISRKVSITPSRPDPVFVLWSITQNRKKQIVYNIRFFDHMWSVFPFIVSSMS